jgi:hypothetical protein
MTSSFELWQKLPTGFLKKKYPGWCRLDYDVQCLIVELAEQQEFKCALCSKTKRLEIEHDPDPVFGPGGLIKTIYNIRGLACRGCNWRIMMFEAEDRGESVGWENCSFTLYAHQYSSYIDRYETRAYPLIQAARKLELGPLNYFRRWNLLWKFDHWKEWPHEKYPWYWGFEEIKAKRHGKIRTPRQAMKYLTALTEFILEQEKDPTWRPSHQFLKAMFKLKRSLDKIIAEVERARGLPVMAKPGSNVEANEWFVQTPEHTGEGAEPISERPYPSVH